MNSNLAWSIKINEIAETILQHPENYSLLENSSNRSIRNPFKKEQITHDFTNKSFFLTNDNKVTVIGQNQQAFLQRFSCIVEFSDTIQASPKMKILNVTVNALENDFYREKFNNFSFQLMLSRNNNIIDLTLNNNLSKSQLLALEILLEECFFPTPNTKLFSGSIWNTKNFNIDCKFYQKGFENYFLEKFYLNNSGERFAHITAHENKTAISKNLMKNYSSKQSIALNLKTNTIENSDSYIIINTLSSERKVLMKQHINVKYLGSTKKLQEVLKSYYSY